MYQLAPPWRFFYTFSGCLFSALLALAACTGDIIDPNLDDPPDQNGDAGGPGADGAPGPVDAGPPPPDADPDDPAWMAMCARWNQDRAALVEGAFFGDVGACDPGTYSAEGVDSSLISINLYRYLADLPPVQNDAGRDAMAQECALMMDANNSLSHNPPPGWNCYTDNGAMAAGRSNIATTPSVAAVDLYMLDSGNATTLGHRRWILSNSLGPVGIGSTNSYSCMWVIGGSGDGNNEWTAYPPPGPFPIEAVNTGFGSIDNTGWSLQSDSLDLGNAQVTVTADGQELPVNVTELLPNYGSSSAISFIPQGWTSEPGSTYRVQVAGVGAAIDYQVEMVSCGG